MTIPCAIIHVESKRGGTAQTARPRPTSEVSRVDSSHRTSGPNPRSPEERFWPKVDKFAEGGCWLWTASKTGPGYGQFGVAQGNIVLAHRYAYELVVGPIPEGLTLDHLCRNRACVNPAHLEPVSMAENLLRGTSPAAANARKTHCPSGHPLYGENLYVDPRGRRGCRECRRESNRRSVLKNGETATILRNLRRATQQKQKQTARWGTLIEQALSAGIDPLAVAKAAGDNVTELREVKSA